MWILDDVCAMVAAGLESAAAALDAEQASLGLDARSELELHPLIRAALRSDEWTIAAEQRYPASAGKPARSHGERCDVVLLPGTETHLVDPLSCGTLFGARGIQPEDALWIEIKAIGQYVFFDGYARPNPGYASELLQGVSADVRKLAQDERIARACALMVLFTESRAVAEHDLGAWTRRAIERGLPISSPLRRGFAIADRIGNAWCEVAITQVHRL